jgi:RimJ/RimL family protein N-acetyltransferase
MNLIVSDQILLSEIRRADKAAYLEHLNEKEIYDLTLRIPFPYTEADADAWLALVEKRYQAQGRHLHWAIRNAEGYLIGAIGFDGSVISKDRRAEVGYWLAKPYWGRGIMTAVVRRACDFAFNDWGLVKITANVFAFNVASARVLEKCGFEQEGYLKRHVFKNGNYCDRKMFALLR